MYEGEYYYRSNNNFTTKEIGLLFFKVIKEEIHAFCYLCIKKSLYTTNLLREWDELKQLGRSSTKRGKTQICFESKLDKLFDIVKCK